MEIEALKLTLEAAKHIQSVYINNVWTTMGSYLVAFGWLLTSVEARNYLKDHPQLLSNIVRVVLGIFMIHALVLVTATYDSYLLLKDLSVGTTKLTPERFDALTNSYAIPCHWPAISLLINGLIVFLLTQKLQQLQKSKET